MATSAPFAQQRALRVARAARRAKTPPQKNREGKSFLLLGCTRVCTCGNKRPRLRNRGLYRWRGRCFLSARQKSGGFAPLGYLVQCSYEILRGLYQVTQGRGPSLPTLSATNFSFCPVVSRFFLHGPFKWSAALACAHERRAPYVRARRLRNKRLYGWRGRGPGASSKYLHTVATKTVFAPAKSAALARSLWSAGPTR